MRVAVVLLALLASVGLAQTCGAGFRPFMHAAGSNCVPVTPERVAAFDTTATELFLALDVKPALRSAFLERFQTTVFPDLQDDLTGDLNDMGFPINQEVLLAAKLDVIITNTDFADLFPENTEQIAPLIVLDEEAGWKPKLIVRSQCVGRYFFELLLASTLPRSHQTRCAPPRK